ncbi:NAD-dependent epimerase/dehydratase family protein [Rahnella aceris]
MKKIIVFGGDGFCGWPTSLALSQDGNDVTIVDNFSRRHIDDNLSSGSLTDVKSIDQRLNKWFELTGKEINFIQLDVCSEVKEIERLLNDIQPDVIIHFAEQRSAPYSMLTPETNRYTVTNNVSGTNNLLSLLVRMNKKVHFIHLGSVGVYGYNNLGYEIPEGYIDVEIEGKDGRISKEVFAPTDPGSIYHLTKVMDSNLFNFYAKYYGLDITDLHQGIVWGGDTLETSMHEDLVNRFDFDGEFGTVLNRFLVQATNHENLTVYGKGEQTRAFINIQDTVNCIRLAIEKHKPITGRVEVRNQIAETKSINQIAAVVADIFSVDISHIENPRLECEQHTLNVSNKSFLLDGLQPILINASSLRDISKLIEKNSSRFNKKLMGTKAKWKTV